MKYVTASLILIIALRSSSVLAASFYEQKINSINGKTIDLNTYKGKPLLIVNIATQCGYTPQLKQLEELYQKYKDKGLSILGIPSNDFGRQTPEDNKEVKKFCLLNYGVSFALSEKMPVKAEKKNPFIEFLLKHSKEQNEIAWNFEKFLISKKGEVVKRYKSDVSPMSKKLIGDIESNL